MKLLTLVLVMSASWAAHAHSGRTNSEGCHNNRKTGDYHCHNSGTKSTPARAASGSYTPESCPVVGNTKSKIYHVAGGASYTKMLVRNKGRDNRKCFDTESEAVSAGYRKSKR